MNTTKSSLKKVNALTRQVKAAVNAENEDHTITLELLKNLQLAIKETRQNLPS